MYHVTASLPAGQQLYTQVEVHNDQSATVVLEPDPADASPQEDLEVQRFIVPARGLLIFSDGRLM